MCRHLAWMATDGAGPASLHDLVLAAPHSLQVQAWAPRHQRFGTVNVDGYGVGWYVPDRDEPVRFRRAQPIWTDASFASLAPAVTTTAALAAVRSATQGFAASDETCCAPFTHGRWLFSHNGRVDGLVSHRDLLDDAVWEVPDVRAPVDSAVVFGVALRAWLDGAGLGEGLAHAVSTVRSRVGPAGVARLSLLATDGTALAGTTCGEALVVRRDGRGTVLASEPTDDEPGWQELPPGCLVVADPGGVRVTPLAEPTEETA